MASLLSTLCKCRAHTFGMNGLDLLQFTYKVSLPLELIANAEAIKKYNQVMGFLLKVKRAKILLDKARRWMQKGRGNAANNYKRCWLVEQKLLHFVDTFHQYLMDRMYHNAWRELHSVGELFLQSRPNVKWKLNVLRDSLMIPLPSSLDCSPW